MRTDGAGFLARGLVRLLVATAAASTGGGAPSDADECAEEVSAGRAASWTQDKASMCCVLHGVCPDIVSKGDAAVSNVTAGAVSSASPNGTGAKGKGISHGVAGNKIYNCTGSGDTRPDKWPVEKQQMCCIQKGIGCPGVDYRGTLNHLQPWAAETHTTTSTITTESNSTTVSMTVTTMTNISNTTVTTESTSTTVAVEDPSTTSAMEDPLAMEDLTTTVTSTLENVFARLKYEGKSDECDRYAVLYLEYMNDTVEGDWKVLKRAKKNLDENARRDYCSAQKRDELDEAEKRELGMSWEERKREIGRQMNASDPEAWRPDFSQALKRAYCCRKVDTSWCKVEEDKYAYKCDQDDNEWKEKWVFSKKLFCCFHFDVGCTVYSEICPRILLPETVTITETTAVSTTTTSATAPMASTTTATTATTLDPQSCRTDLENWQTAWPIAKKKECCTKFLTFNVWPEDTEKECCSNGFAACDQDDTPEYDCEAAYPNWRTAWSEEKQGWCCVHYKRGCQDASSSGLQSGGAASIDCSPDAPDTTEWSQEKKRWCCMYEDVGCHDLVADSGFVAKYTQSATLGLTASPASELARTWLVGVVLLAPVALGVHTLCRRRADHLPVANRAELLNVDVELE